VKIGFKFQSLGKISNISAADRPPPVLLGQFQHWHFCMRLLTIISNGLGAWCQLV